MRDDNMLTSEEFEMKCASILKQHAFAVTNELVNVLMDWPGAEKNKKAEKKKEYRLTKKEQDIFYLILENINWRTKNSNVVTLRTMDIAYQLGWAFDGENIKKTTYEIRETLASLKRKSSVITIKNLSNSGYIHASLLGNIFGNSDRVSIEINRIFMPYLQDFNGKFRYTTFWTEDIRKMESFLGRQLYVAFKYYADFDKENSTVELGTRQLKSEIFCCEKEDYTHKVNGKESAFNRTLWEKRQLLLACEDINKNAKYVKILPQVDEKGNACLYTKTYKGRKVDKYVFKIEVDHELMDKGRYYQNFEELEPVEGYNLAYSL